MTHKRGQARIKWQDGDFYIGFINEYPDYLTQGTTKEELTDNLKDILSNYSGAAVFPLPLEGEGIAVVVLSPGGVAPGWYGTGLWPADFRANGASPYQPGATPQEPSTQTMRAESPTHPHRRAGLVT